jgi:hypothetical protein
MSAWRRFCRPSKAGPAGLVVLGLALLMAFVVAGALPAPAEAQACLANNTCLHGIGFAKGCLGPTPIGDPYTCSYSVTNSPTIDTALDTLTFKGIVDIVHALPSDVNSGNILPALTIGSLVGGATCNTAVGGGGANVPVGSSGANECTVPSGGAVIFDFFSFYTVDANDPDPLTDDVTLTWDDTNSSQSGNAPSGDQSATTGSRSTLTCAECPADGVCGTFACNEVTNLCEPTFSPATTICRDSAGVCDVAESCTGTSVDCPADSFQAATTICRGSAGVCDVAESCTGTSADCPADTFQAATTICRGSAGVCDVAESCTGTSADCPADTFQAATTICRDSAGVCDVAESCTGTSAACPPDSFQAATTICRDSAGVCDVAESCTGTSAACPPDSFQAATTICRDSAGVCDVAESCTGTSAACPPDSFQAATTICRDSAGVCDVAESCTGTSAACPPDGFMPETTICRPASDTCDVAESCTGTSVDCPPDVHPVCAAICRTPGFWGTHARTSDKGSGAFNLTQIVINMGGGSLDICGECISTTVPINDASSAVEALCVAPQGAQELQLARQLTAASLNCIASNGQADCTGTIVESVFTNCNDNVCLSGDTNAITTCINQLDCYNNGFEPGDGTSCGPATGCHTADIGFCKVNGKYDNPPVYCSAAVPCANPNATCAPGNAGSSDDCNAATQNACTVIGAGQASCSTDSCP